MKKGEKFFIFETNFSYQLFILFYVEQHEGKMKWTEQIRRGISINYSVQTLKSKNHKHTSEITLNVDTHSGVFIPEKHWIFDPHTSQLSYIIILSSMLAFGSYIVPDKWLNKWDSMNFAPMVGVAFKTSFKSFGHLVLRICGRLADNFESSFWATFSAVLTHRLGRLQPRAPNLSLA